jgi:hypothetical protein
VVEIQIAPVKSSAAVLAGIFIALKNIVPCEVDDDSTIIRQQY